MPTLIPFEPGNPRYRFETDLGEDAVVLDVRYNSIEDRFYFDLFDDKEKPIIRGVKVVLGCNLARRSTHPILCRNVIRAFDTAGNGGRGVDAGLDALGGRVIVMNWTLDEIAGVVT